MDVCSSCGHPYSPTSDAWGTECGICIASKIEAGLAHLAAAERKPMRRAIPKADEEPEAQPLAAERAA